MQRLSRRRECLNLLKRITLLPERVPSYDEFPYDIPFVRDLDLAFGKAVTCFVADNGRASRRSSRRSPRRARCRSGAAAATRRPIPTGRISAPRSAAHCAFAFSRRPRDGYFFRADPDFQGDPYARYGGRSLRRSSPSC